MRIITKLINKKITEYFFYLIKSINHMITFTFGKGKKHPYHISVTKHLSLNFQPLQNLVDSKGQITLI